MWTFFYPRPQNGGRTVPGGPVSPRAMVRSG